MIDTISSFIDGVRIAGVVLFVVFIGVSIFLITNTTKITVYSRRREVGIMKFVGATDWFIRWPFIIEGMIIGFVGSLLASLLLYFLYKGIFGYIVSTMFLVSLVPPSFVLGILIWAFLARWYSNRCFRKYSCFKKILRCIKLLIKRENKLYTLSGEISPLKILLREIFTCSYWII